MSNRLGITLHNLRKQKGISLRKVEKDTGISNAYLSQLERSVAKRPSPEKLRILAEYLSVPYIDLLKCAGYWHSQTTDGASELISGRSEAKENISVLVSSITELTEDEESLVLHYIEFLKERRKRPNKS